MKLNVLCEIRILIKIIASIQILKLKNYNYSTIQLGNFD